MFRSRFNEAFPRGAPHLGPQDLELGAAEETPSADVEGLLCALLGLVLNRKKPVESVQPCHTPNICGLWSHRCSKAMGNSWLTLLCSTEKVIMAALSKKVSKPKSRSGHEPGVAQIPLVVDVAF
jgi:hypothetical protein